MSRAMIMRRSPASDAGDAGAVARKDRPIVRLASDQDLEALLALETACFATDRLSRRSYHALLTRAHAKVLIAERNATPVGAAVILFHSNSAVARLYSLAISPAVRGAGIGRLLLRQAQMAALNQGRRLMHLEVRLDNAPARHLYESEGFRAIRRLPGYYADGMGGLRLERPLLSPVVR